jgi:signal peptidase I
LSAVSSAPTAKRKLPLPAMLAVALVAVTTPVWGSLLMRRFVVESFRIPSASMTPTLITGDTVLCLKSAAARAPTRGGVRVFVYPRDRTKDFVSRVVGVAGDRVQVRLDGTVERNGVALRRCRLGPWPAASGQAASDAFMEADGALRYAVLQSRVREPGVAEHCVAAPCTVPAGHALTLGDHRDNSYDGRYWGFVPVGDFKAAPWRIFSPVNGSEGERTWLDPQGPPALPAALRGAWRRCLDELR